MKPLSIIFFCLWISLSVSVSAELETKKIPGKVVAANVGGEVMAVEAESNAARSLKTRDVLSENYTVDASEDSEATLVFSNGATINLHQKSKLVISEFLQNPFGTPFSMPVEDQEPTVSTAKLNLTEGEVVCKVKKLHSDKGSSLTIDTPVGAAGVRGTTFAVSYFPNKHGNGKGSYLLSVSEGTVSLTDKDGNVTLVTAGQELEILFTSRVNPLTGKITVIEIFSKRSRDIPLDRLNRIKRIADQGEFHADFVIFEAYKWDLLHLEESISTIPPIIYPPNSVTEVNP